jgi:hypothetical protein
MTYTKNVVRKAQSEDTGCAGTAQLCARLVISGVHTSHRAGSSYV